MADTRPAGQIAAGETLRDLYARMGLADRYYDGATRPSYSAARRRRISRRTFSYSSHTEAM